MGMPNQYSINLMWINDRKYETGEFVCKDHDDIDYELDQLKKWKTSNPEAAVNFWYDSQLTNENAIENTKKLLEDISTEFPPPPILLRDIRELPIVQENRDFFQPEIPVYFRVDILKLILCAYGLEQEKMDAVIFSDFSIAEKVEKALTKEELFNDAILEKHEKYGMILGYDGSKCENQFLQVVNTPELGASLKHAINSSLLIAQNHLNYAINKNNSGILAKLYCAPYLATLNFVHLYLSANQRESGIQIRADIAEGGNKDDWVPYNPERHNYILYGNYIDRGGTETFYGHNLENENEPKITEKLEEFIKVDNDLSKFFGNRIYGRKEMRSDLNPGREGRNHSWNGSIPRPLEGEKFSCTFVSLEPTLAEAKHSLDDECEPPQDYSSLNLI